MVMPRSRSIGLESSTWASISRSARPPQIWMMRSASVDLPWSMCAMMEKLRISSMGYAVSLHRQAETPAACPRDGGTNPALSHGTPSRLRPGGHPRAAAGTGGSLAVGHRDADETALLAAAHQQQHRAARLDVLGCRTEVGHAADGVLVHPQNHVARAKACLRGGFAGNVRHLHPLARAQSHLLAIVGTDRTNRQAEGFG